MAGQLVAGWDRALAQSFGSLRTPVSEVEGLARFLGWFSIGLGLAELVAPRQIGAAAGVDAKPGLLQAYGVREFLAGVGILTTPWRAPWLWARVAGDAVDLATLGPGLYSTSRTRRKASAVATAAVLAIGLLDIYAAWRSR